MDKSIKSVIVYHVCCEYRGLVDDFTKHIKVVSHISYVQYRIVKKSCTGSVVNLKVCVILAM